MKNYLRLTLLMIIKFFFVLGLSQNINAQNYLINFTANGGVLTLNNVMVENLTSGASLNLNGTDTLRLLGTADAYNVQQEKTFLHIYPNPMGRHAIISFFLNEAGATLLNIYDVAGKTIIQCETSLSHGAHSFKVSGLSQGVYFLQVQSINFNYTKKLIAIGAEGTVPQIVKTSSQEDLELNTYAVGQRSTKAIVNMPYTNGDMIRFTGYVGSNNIIVNDVPSSSKTINFVFPTSFICGDTLVDTRDNTPYPTVQIGNQCWMAKNLAYLPNVVGPSTGSQTSPYYYVYLYNGTIVNDAKATTYYNTYGVLYNWSAAMNGVASSTASPSGVQGVCPIGWHLPSDTEWNNLVNYLGYFDAGAKLKEAGTTHWDTPNTGATNATGFTALPGGYREVNGGFYNIGSGGHWWSTTEHTTDNAKGRYMAYDHTSANSLNYDKARGFSVRCIKD